jgi:hypothetical protein
VGHLIREIIKTHGHTQISCHTQIYCVVLDFVYFMKFDAVQWGGVQYSTPKYAVYVAFTINHTLHSTQPSLTNPPHKCSTKKASLSSLRCDYFVYLYLFLRVRARLKNCSLFMSKISYHHMWYDTL